MLLLLLSSASPGNEMEESGIVWLTKKDATARRRRNRKIFFRSTAVVMNMPCHGHAPHPRQMMRRERERSWSGRTDGCPL